MNLLKIACFSFFSLITGCSILPKDNSPVVTTTSAPRPKPVLVSNYKRPEEMDRQEVIESVKQCQSARMKPVIRYVLQTTEFGKIKTPVDVHCETYKME